MDSKLGSSFVGSSDEDEAAMVDAFFLPGGILDPEDDRDVGYEDENPYCESTPSFIIPPIASPMKVDPWGGLISPERNHSASKPSFVDPSQPEWLGGGASVSSPMTLLGPAPSQPLPSMGMVEHAVTSFETTERFKRVLEPPPGLSKVEPPPGFESVPQNSNPLGLIKPILGEKSIRKTCGSLPQNLPGSSPNTGLHSPSSTSFEDLIRSGSLNDFGAMDETRISNPVCMDIRSEPALEVPSSRRVPQEPTVRFMPNAGGDTAVEQLTSASKDDVVKTKPSDFGWHSSDRSSVGHLEITNEVVTSPPVICEQQNLDYLPENSEDDKTNTMETKDCQGDSFSPSFQGQNGSAKERKPAIPDDSSEVVPPSQPLPSNTSPSESHSASMEFLAIVLPILGRFLLSVMSLSEIVWKIIRVAFAGARNTVIYATNELWRADGAFPCYVVLVALPMICDWMMMHISLPHFSPHIMSTVALYFVSGLSRPSHLGHSTRVSDEMCRLILRTFRFYLPITMVVEGFGNPNSTVMMLDLSTRLIIAYILSLVRASLIFSPLGWAGWSVQVILSSFLPEGLISSCILSIVGPALIRLISVLPALCTEYRGSEI